MKKKPEIQKHSPVKIHKNKKPPKFRLKEDSVSPLQKSSLKFRRAEKLAKFSFPTKKDKSEKLTPPEVSHKGHVLKGVNGVPKDTVKKELSAKDTAPKVGRPPGKKGKKESHSASSGRQTASDPSGEAVCREVACEGLTTTGGYCRLHYIKNWKKIKRKELILREGKLNQYIEELVAKYPDKYIEAIRQDLASDKDFAKVIYDLDLDEGLEDFEMEGESVDSLIGSIKRDFEDEGGEGTF